MNVGRISSRATIGGSKSKLFQGAAVSGATLALCIMPIAWSGARAATFTLNDGITVTLQTTLDYTGGIRTAPVDSQIATLNTDDGDRNFRSGVMANRLQTLEQLNVRDGDYGLRASAFAWLDTVYLQNSKNNSPNTFNSYGIGTKGFPSQTVANEGRRIEPLALFLYGTEYFDGGEQNLKWQIGRQTITWGEALFSLDGISGLQAPVDAYEGSLLPNPQAQALFLPTGAVSLNYNFGDGNSVAAYWQFEYEADILPGVGSYFSPADIVGPGAQRILASPIDEGAASLYRAPDITPANGLDQFGVSAHTRIGQYGIGAYFVRGIPKGPNVYVNAFARSSYKETPTGLSVGQYNLAYAQPVNAYALSFTALAFGNANVTGEISGRTNQPLVGSESLYTSSTPASYNHPLYPIGDVLDAQLSMIDLTPPLPLMPNGTSIAAELTMNKVLTVTRNRENLEPGRTAQGASFEITFEPSYYPLPNLEVEFPIGWTTAFYGKSQYDSTENAGTGTIDVGITGVYRSVWTMGLNYQRYYGSASGEPYLDRDFATLFLQYSF